MLDEKTERALGAELNRAYMKVAARFPELVQRELMLIGLARLVTLSDRGLRNLNQIIMGELADAQMLNDYK
jgi:hypothetical protein